MKRAGRELNCSSAALTAIVYWFSQVVLTPRMQIVCVCYGNNVYRQPLVSGIYERGWRQGFTLLGSPGADKEFNMILNYLQRHFGVAPSLSDSTNVMSCVSLAGG